MDQIQLPLTFILSNDARGFLKRNNINSSNIHLSDGRILPGIRINKYHMNFLQSFLFNGYLMSSELCIKDIAQDRAAFTDVAKAFIFAALYRRFDCEAFDLLTKHEVVSLWNKNHSRFLITYDRRNNEKIAQLIASRKNLIAESQKQLIENMLLHLKRFDTMYDENPKLIRNMAARFLINCSSATKMMLYLFKHDKQSVVLDKFAEVLAKYIQKTRIADYFSMLLIELTLQVSMQQQKNLVSTELNEVTMLPDIDTQDTSATYVIWNFSQRQNIPKERVQLRVALSNKKSEYHNLHSRLTQDVDEVLSHANIQEYYLSSNDPEKDAKLGLSYLYYVENECKRLNLHFESFISTIPMLQQALYNVSLLI